MLQQQLNRLRHRLDALGEGRVLSTGVLDRARALFERGELVGPLKELHQLDHELDKVGVHTAADAKLLKQLGVQKASADRDRARLLRMEVSQARERARSVPAVRSLQDLARHVRLEARRDPSTAYRSLRALYERAVEANDAALAQVARDAVGVFLPAA